MLSIPRIGPQQCRMRRIQHTVGHAPTCLSTDIRHVRILILDTTVGTGARVEVTALLVSTMYHGNRLIICTHKYEPVPVMIARLYQSWKGAYDRASINVLVRVNKTSL